MVDLTIHKSDPRDGNFTRCGLALEGHSVAVNESWVTCVKCLHLRNMYSGKLDETAEPSEPKVQMEVTYSDDTTRYFPVNATWRVDVVHNELVVGKGLERTHIPLSNVRSYGPRPYKRDAKLPDNRDSGA